MGENVAPGPSYKHEVKNSRNEPLDISLDNYMLLLHLSKICMYFLGQRNVKSTITLEKYPLMKELYLTIKGSAIFSRFQFQYAIKGCFLIIAEPFLYTGNTMYHSSKKYYADFERWSISRVRECSLFMGGSAYAQISDFFPCANILVPEGGPVCNMLSPQYECFYEL